MCIAYISFRLTVILPPHLFRSTVPRTAVRRFSKNTIQNQRREVCGDECGSVRGRAAVGRPGLRYHHAENTTAARSGGARRGIVCGSHVLWPLALME